MIRTVQEEVTDFLHVFFSQRHPSTGSRNVAMVRYLYGFGGAAEPTQEAAAERFEIGKTGQPDRERARQILDDAKGALSRTNLRSVDAFVDLVTTAPFWLSSELAPLVLERGLVDEPFSVSGLLRLAKDTGHGVEYTLRPPDLSEPTSGNSADWVRGVEEKHEAVLVLHLECVSLAKGLLKQARKFHRRYGLARVDDLLDEPECSDIPHRHRILEQLLKASEDAWVGSEGGSTWYLFEDQQHVFKNVADKVFSVTDACDPNHLAEACLRYLAGRKGKSYPHSPAPASLIRRYFETSTAFEAADGRVRYAHGGSGGLRPVEEHLVACLKESPSGATGAYIGDYLVAREQRRGSIRWAIGNSPLAHRVGERGSYRYSLIGTEPDGSSTMVGRMDNQRYGQYRDRLDRLAQTDEDAEVKIRKEQKILSGWLFDGKDEECCALCQRVYMRSALVAAHKKKRASCNPAERRDPHIVMPLCVFGCDFVYENRYVVVRDGVAIPDDLEGCSEAVKKYAKRLDGRRICDQWLAGKPWYFDNADRGAIR